MTTHRDPEHARQLQQTFVPLADRLLQQQQHVVRRAALAWATRRVPREAVIAGGLALLLSMLLPLPFWLPPLVLLLLLVLRVSHMASVRPFVVRPLDAALACDRAHGNHDRLAAALELAAAEPGTAGQAEALARAAIDDGVASLQRVDALRADASWQAAAPAWGRAVVALCALAVFVWLLPAGSAGGPGDAGAVGGERVADARPTEPVQRDVAQAERPRVPTPPAAATTPTPPPTSPDPKLREQGKPARSEPQPAVPAATGAGRAGSDTPGESSQSGAPKAAPSGSPGSGQPGGGQGSAAAGAPEPAPQPARPESKPKPKKKAEQKPSRDKPAPASESAGTPSGGSRGSGNTAPVGNKRQDLSRSQERDDEPEVEDEPIEDETDEQEQRGGVMPLKRQDQRPAARELSISGDGPPDQGRGGPTPPKKARGTASLVLGLRLPDQIRGQPNPGTAKTSLEQIPPQRQQADAGQAQPAAAGRPGTPQSARPTATPLHALLARYHARLRELDSSTPGGSDAADPPRR